ncbi:type II toxin-antitoxin system HicA family toxin [Megamonas hypermegale]|nr:type II toxin-antitoxin system HicA family toxin [Megamonas hypermegale]
MIYLFFWPTTSICHDIHLIFISCKITIPNHPGDIDPRTLKSILRQAGLK